MKALFQRLQRSTSSKDRDQDPQKTPKDSLSLPPPKESSSQSAPSTDASRPTSAYESKPLPAIHSDADLPPPPINDIAPAMGDTDRLANSSAKSTPLPQPSSSQGSAAARKMSHAASTDVQKKVAFISPSTTPTPHILERVDTVDSTHSAMVSTNGYDNGPARNNVTRFQATHTKGAGSNGSLSASNSKPDLPAAGATTSSKASIHANSTRTVTPSRGYQDAASLRSGTPYSQSNSSSRILAAASWSEGAEDDLVSNLGSRERTRQEVLWEIVASEERYVNELSKLRETFIEPLLHPYTAPTSPTPLGDDDYFPQRVESPVESLEQLPIAARFMSPTAGHRSTTPTTLTPHIDGESADSDEDEDRLGVPYSAHRNGKHSSSRSPYRAAATKTRAGGAVAFPSRSHQSLPAPPRAAAMSSTHSLGRQSTEPEERDRPRNNSTSGPSINLTGSRVLRRFRKSAAQPEDILAPHQLPDDLRICLETIENGILDGHLKLSDGLRKRYEEQYPLVRSLADVFVSSSHIFQGYATYVLHLERALEQVDNALSTASATKKPKGQDSAEWLKVCKFLQRLENVAADKGETGLAISLSKPFQRLLKYPLLFQNLLFHTDPSTFEYESTLVMVAEVETIVRSIEDEKIQKEERDKTRDAFARIEGLEKIKQLAVPKPSRLLVEEKPVPASGSASTSNSSPPSRSPSTPPSASAKGSAVKGKTSFRRLSDALGANGIGGKKDLWLVTFNDVVLRCQRTGTTSVPLVSSSNSRATSLPELQGKAKYATTGRRGNQTRPRNLYKFIKIETWTIGDAVQAREGVVSMEDVARARDHHLSAQPRVMPMPDDDEDDDGDSDDSDKKSKMSFSYWGADKVTIQKPVVKPRIGGSGLNPARRGSPLGATSYGRESSANAKFGTRMMSPDLSASGSMRPASRRTQATPSSRRPATSDDGHGAMKASVAASTRPPWGGGGTVSTRTTSGSAGRSRNTSQNGSTRPATTTAKDAVASAVAIPKQIGSPVPSEDSGVGLYRQMMVKNPSLNHD